MKIKNMIKKMLFQLKNKKRIDSILKMYYDTNIEDIPNDTLNTIYFNFKSAFNNYVTDENKFDMMKKVIDSFYNSKIIKIKQSFDINNVDGNLSPILITTVKNDLQRIKLLLNYYGEIGINNFVILDNGSTDGTREFLKKQKNVNLYLCSEEYETYKKEGWVNRLICYTGLNKWYLIVDSDELFDYIGREKHNIDELIVKLKENNIKRAKGILVDMYSKNPLFSDECDYLDIPKVFKYFDSNSYKIVRKSFVSHIEGGPRERMLASKNIWVSKCPLLYFDKKSLIINAHFQYPLKEYEKAPYISFIRHYKYLKSDYKPFYERMKKGNFSGNSEFYKNAILFTENKTNLSFYNKDSKTYRDSSSIKIFNFIRNMFQ